MTQCALEKEADSVIHQQMLMKAQAEVKKFFFDCDEESWTG